MFRLPRYIVMHSKGLKSIADHLRNVKALPNATLARNYSTNDGISDDLEKNKTKHNKIESFASSHDREICLLGPKDIRAPLPGNIGIAMEFHNSTKINEFDNKIVNAEDTVEMITAESNYLRHYRVMEQVLSPEYEDNRISVLPHELECVAHECPELLVKDFQELFPVTCRMRPELSKRLTVMTLCQKTDNDMNAWTAEVDTEREELMEHFVVVAKEICNYLTEAGFWADFVDPSSGRPFLGEYTNATLFETDDRYRNFGFTIEDLGCCKVISHHLWGTHSFVGALFTNAPANSDELKKVLLNPYIK